MADHSSAFASRTLWTVSYDKPRQHIRNQRHHFSNKGLSSQTYGFPSGHVWMWELDHKEGWVQTIDLSNCGAGEDSWESFGQQGDFLQEINPEYSLEGLMLKLELQYSGHLIWRADSLEKTLMLGKIEGRRRRGRQRMRWLGGITDSMDMGLSKLSNWTATTTNPEVGTWLLSVICPVLLWICVNF